MPASNLNGLQVTFDGQAAPLIYTSANGFRSVPVWAVAFLLMRKKLGRENLQQEIEELRAFEREGR